MSTERDRAASVLLWLNWLNSQQSGAFWRSEFGDFISDADLNRLLGGEPQVMSVEMRPLFVRQLRPFLEDAFNPVVLNLQNLLGCI